MPGNRDIAALLDIEQAAQKILRYKQGLDKTAFMKDDKT
jgi:uncharacterized protein with HEPN domain